MQAFVKIIIVILLLVLTLAGCKPVVVSGTCSFCDYPNNTNAPASNSNNTQKTRSFAEYTIPTIVVDKDVDIAFINIKREFGFWTETELRADFGSHQGLADAKIGSTAFAYNAVPGVYYNMRKVILNKGEENKRPEFRQGHVLDVLIEKESVGNTSITLKYWSKYNEEEIQQYEIWIKSKLEKALKLKLF